MILVKIFYHKLDLTIEQSVKFVTLSMLSKGTSESLLKEFLVYTFNKGPLFSSSEFNEKQTYCPLYLLSMSLLKSTEKLPYCTPQLEPCRRR